MAIVKVLIDHVGNYMAGDIVTDAPLGLVEIAEKGTRNAATGELVAAFVSETGTSNDTDVAKIMSELRESAISLGIPDVDSLSITGLIEAIARAISDLAEKEKADALQLEKQKADQETADTAAIAELADLKEKAKELKVPGYTKMVAEELKVAIEAVGGGKVAE